jgi:hypothetical protein
LQEKLATNALSDILADPDAHQHAAKVYAASLVLNIACAHRSRPSPRSGLTRSHRRQDLADDL